MAHPITVAMEIEKLTELGKSFGLEGAQLKDFVMEERARLKNERDEERRLRAEERAHEKNHSRS